MEQAVENYEFAFNKAKDDFNKLKDIHPVLNKFHALIPKIDIEGNASLVANEIEQNLIEFWTNSKYRKADLEAKLDALLFEYSSLDELDSKAYAYGVINLKLEKLVFEDVNTLENYDLLPNFQSLPGITLSVTNVLHQTHWSELEEDYPDLEIYFEYGWEELQEVYKGSVYLVLSKAIQIVNEKNIFDLLRTNPNFCILIQEHDCGARLIAKKNIA